VGQPRTDAGTPLAAVLDAGHAAIRTSRRFRVTGVGRAARRALVTEPGWRVFSVFRRSFYCQNSLGALVLVGPERLGAGPLHVLWGGVHEAGSPRPVERMPVGLDIDGTRVPVAGGLTLDLRGAQEWWPPLPPEWCPSRLGRSLAWLGGVADRAPLEGLGRLLALVATGTIDRSPSQRASLLGHAQPAVAALSGWIRAALAREPAAKPTRLPDAIGDLIGPGPGLTPSGDDVLAGALLALHGFARADVADRLATWLHPRLEGRTGLVSRAHLGCAAGGEGAAVLHDALAALACGDTGSLTAATAAVGTLGHCSGWDALVGIAVVAKAWLANEAGGRERSTPCR